ncbi:MAG: U32 family peptidase [Deltaproteobacteria bacterium]|nr:U32 family peptidase [Deltaproteobacteria bacterium]
MELTLGPALFEWKKDELFRFYEDVASMPVDRVYIGEAVCVKKRGLGEDELRGVISMLQKAGKKVALSSLAVISNEEELEFTRRLIALHPSIEANDMAVMNMVDAKKTEVFAGPHITTYNGPSIEFLKGAGVRRVSFPVEMSREAISHAVRETGVESEVFAHGKAPLAFSWRCYTSRAHGLDKTGCKHHCAMYPDGMELKTLEGTPVFTVNGTSILSADVYSLIDFVEDLREIGVAALRISPQYKNTADVVQTFRKRLDGELNAQEAVQALRATTTNGFCNGWYAGKAGIELIEAAGLGIG